MKTAIEEEILLGKLSKLDSIRKEVWRGTEKWSKDKALAFSRRWGKRIYKYKLRIIRQYADKQYKQKLAEMMPKGRKPANRKELSLWNYWDATTSEQRIDIVQRAFKMIEAQNKYIKLLGKELDELAVLAHNRGWRSKRAKQGEQIRKEIKSLLTQEKKEYPIGGFAPGNYQNRCVTCKELFIGDKRAWQCESCAIKSTQEEE